VTHALPPGPHANVDVAEQQRYWHETLSGDLPVLRLTPDYPRPPVSSFIRDVASLDLDQSLYQHVLKFCAEQQVSLNVVLLAAYNALFHRYTGEDDILVGSVAPDCMRWSDTKQPQRFTNLIALRTHLAGNPDFLTLLSRTTKTIEEANRHRDYPFAKVLEIVRSKQGDHSSAIIHNLFALCRTNAGSTEAALYETDLAEVDEYTSQCDIVCVAVVHGEKLIISCHYDAELFESATVVRLLGHYQSLLRAMVSHPETAISALPLLTDAERHQLLVEWNDTKAEYPKDKCIHELFAEQVERTPDAVAVVFDEQQVTYREINARANQLAHHLQKLGVQEETLVGLCMERSVDMIVALLGILKAGGAYVPLDPSYPRERLRFIVEDTQTAVVVTQGRFSQALPDGLAHRVCLDDDWEKVERENITNPKSRARAENLAYVLYTSGSTGVPKGVMVEHRGVSKPIRLLRDLAHPSNPPLPSISR
jgi:non-ribosomal peptide synthetase component F